MLALAGRQTLADIGIKVLADITLSKSICFGAAGCGLAYGIAQDRLRRKTIRKKARRIKVLEEMIDPSRSSSNLMHDGRTRPEDEEL